MYQYLQFILKLTLLLLFVSSGIEQSIACGFHNYAPRQSVVDHLLNNNHAILARPDPVDSYRYKIVSYLKGDETKDNIQDLVDSFTRRRLLSNSDDTVLFVRKNNNDNWRRLAYVDSSYRKIINKVLANVDKWSRRYHPDRFNFFEKLQNHPDQVLRELALTELDLAPYELLRNIDLKISPENLVSGLWSIQGMPFLQIRILLLGISKSDIAREEIRRNIAVAAMNDHWSKSFGALVTAFIEAEGIAGVDRVSAYFLSNRKQPLEKAELAVEAMAIHSKVGSRQLKNKITESLNNIIRDRPEIAALVARQFGKRNVWTQVPHLKKLLDNGLLQNTEQIKLVQSYVNKGGTSGIN